MIVSRSTCTTVSVLIAASIVRAISGNYVITPTGRTSVLSRETRSDVNNSLHNSAADRMSCKCEPPNLAVLKRDDYHYTDGLGGHKLHTKAATFNDARKICNEEGGHLAVINSLAEEEVLLGLFNSAGAKICADAAFIGIHDLYNEGEWVTILGDSLYKSGYAKWSERWGGQPDNDNGRGQNCGALMKDGGMDDVYCSDHYGFFCEIPAARTPH